MEAGLKKKRKRKGKARMDCQAESGQRLVVIYPCLLFDHLLRSVSIAPFHSSLTVQLLVSSPPSRDVRAARR